MSRQNFVESRENLSSFSCCLNGFDSGVGGGVRPSIVYQTNKQHPEGQASLGSRSSDFAALWVSPGVPSSTAR